MPRIVSLIASATEIVYALGEIGNLVGRSHECDYPESVKSLPVCTRPRFPVSGDSREIDHLVKETLATSISVYEVFDDVLERLQPTHILTQVQCDVCAVSLRDVENSIAARLASRPQVVALNPDCSQAFGTTSAVWRPHWISRNGAMLCCETCSPVCRRFPGRP